MAGGVGIAAALASVLAGLLLHEVRADDERYDGEFVLDEPGVYDQPISSINRDVTGDRLPDAALEGAGGAPASLAGAAGPMVVNVWFSSCDDCRAELAAFAMVHAEVGDAVRFVGVDPFDTDDAMAQFAAARGVSYELLRDPERAFTTALGIVAFPATLFVDADGVIVRQTGVLTEADLRATLAELFPPAQR